VLKTEQVQRDFFHYLKHECGLAANTLQAYRRDCDRFFAWLATTNIKTWSEITVGKLGEYLAYLQDENLSPSSTARHVASLKTFFKFLVLDEHITASPAAAISRPGMWERTPTVLSSEQVRSLTSAPMARDKLHLRDKALVELLAATGARASEIATLKTADLNLEQRFCKCKGKGDKERLMPFGETAQEALKIYLTAIRPKLVEHRTDPGVVFLTGRGAPLSRIEIWKLFKKYAKRAGVPESASPHTLRHSYATQMLAKGVDLRAIQELLGHSSITTTQHYTRVDADRLRKIHEKFHPRG
jgi:integrase/recombinase XerD